MRMIVDKFVRERSFFSKLLVFFIYDLRYLAIGWKWKSKKEEKKKKSKKDYLTLKTPFQIK